MEALVTWYTSFYWPDCGAEGPGRAGVDILDSNILREEVVTFGYNI